MLSSWQQMRWRSMHAKKKSKTADRIKNLGVEIEAMKVDRADTQKDMPEDNKFFKDMYEQCATKEMEWHIRCKTRAEELLARADIFKILYDDGALELFKRTFPSPAALLQTKVSSEQTQG